MPSWSDKLIRKGLSTPVPADGPPRLREGIPLLELDRLVTTDDTHRADAGDLSAPAGLAPVAAGHHLRRLDGAPASSRRGQPQELRVRPGQRRRRERRLARGEAGGPPGGLRSQTCSAIRWLASSAARPIVSSSAWAVSAASRRASSYSPRSPPSSGQPRPIVLPDPGSARLPLAAVALLAVPVEAGPVPEPAVGRAVAQLVVDHRRPS